MSALARRPLFCTYAEAMSAFERVPSGKRRIDQLMRMCVASAFHEAGHATVSYALGAGAGDVHLTYRQADGRGGYEGSAYFSSAWVAKLNQAHELHLHGEPSDWRRRAANHSILIAAGPAAERKFCVSTGTPLRVRDGSSEDRKTIDRLSAGVSEALPRFAWRRAQLAMQNKAIWAAVRAIAFELDRMMIGDERLYGAVDVVSNVVLCGPRAREIMGDHGVEPGMQLWGES